MLMQKGQVKGTASRKPSELHHQPPCVELPSLLLCPPPLVSPGFWVHIKHMQPRSHSARVARLSLGSMTWFSLLALLLRMASTTQEVQQFPFHTTAPEGGSVSITCSSSKPLYGIFLKQTWPQTTNVIYYDGKQPTVDKQFWNRIAFSGSQENLTITMNHLHLANSGVYTCQAVMEDDIWGSGTMVVVTEKLSQGVCRCQEPQLMSVTLPSILTVGFFLIGIGLGMVCILRRSQIKKLCTSESKNPSCMVYEDMSYSCRNTLSAPNLYQ
ncbi:T-cell antigen CD7 isoform X2 [Castor canadensis]|uniref:T-cell antigen CD7 isoform X2 n=2 Tax=Castor canadensis TaxID=51338 RepID=A0AC58K7M4_CASCN